MSKFPFLESHAPAKAEFKNFVEMRLAHTGDDEAITRLLNVKPGRAYLKEGDWIVLEIEGRLIGTCAVIRQGSPSSESWMENAANLQYLAIDDDYQGLGLSEMLLAEAEERARRQNAKWICLHVDGDAESLARLFQSFGYIRDQSGDLKRAGRSADAYLMALTSVFPPEIC